MKTPKISSKPKLKARRMWAHPGDLVDDGYSNVRLQRRKDAKACEEYVPVAVIPLDDVELLTSKLAAAHYHAERDARVNRRSVTNGDCMHAALVALGVLPKQRKKGRK